MKVKSKSGPVVWMNVAILELASVLGWTFEGNIQLWIKFLFFLFLMRPIHDVASIVLIDLGCGGAEHLHPSVEGELTFSSEEIHVVLELEFEYIVFTDIITLGGGVHIIS